MPSPSAFVMVLAGLLVLTAAESSHNNHKHKKARDASKHVRKHKAAHAQRHGAHSSDEFTPEGESEKLAKYTSKYGKEFLMDVDYVDDGKQPLNQYYSHEWNYSKTTTTTKKVVKRRPRPRPRKRTTTTKPPTTTMRMTTTLPFAECVTHEDPRMTQGLLHTLHLNGKLAKAGTHCVFGVDPRDEGGHCIFNDGKYGTFGWCYTNKAGTEWGSCGEMCPLWGQPKAIDQRIKKLSEKISEAQDKLAPLVAKAREEASLSEEDDGSEEEGSDEEDGSKLEPAAMVQAQKSSLLKANAMKTKTKKVKTMKVQPGGTRRRRRSLVGPSDF